MACLYVATAPAPLGMTAIKYGITKYDFYSRLSEHRRYNPFRYRLELSLRMSLWCDNRRDAINIENLLKEHFRAATCPLDVMTRAAPDAFGCASGSAVRYQSGEWLAYSGPAFCAIDTFYSHAAYATHWLGDGWRPAAAHLAFASARLAAERPGEFHVFIDEVSP